MAKVEQSCWEYGANGLTYPECPYMKKWDDNFKDGHCSSPKVGESWRCTTLQYAGHSWCPFDQKKSKVD